ncbi:MAG: alpha/beta fold hydrolase BchO [Pseudomonadota bacterium]
MTSVAVPLPGTAPRSRLRWDKHGLDWPNRSVSRFIDAAGMRWHVQRTGAGPELLLLHGTGASTHSWRHLLPRLAERFTVTALDLPGHGFTAQPPDGDQSIDAMARRIAEVLAALDVDPAYGLGHSAGAVIGVEMILDGLLAPELMVGINGAFFPFPGVTGPIFGALARVLAGTPVVPAVMARMAKDPEAVERLLQGTGSSIDAEGVALYRRLFEDRSHVRNTLAMMAHWNLHRLQKRLWQLETPLHLIVGERDETVPPRDAERVRERVDSCIVTTEPGLGHLAHEEAPERIATTVLHAVFGAGPIGHGRQDHA